MAEKSAFYGVVAILLAALVVSSSLAVMYYFDYKQEVANSKINSDDLNTALLRYNALSGSFNASLNDYAQTLSLLATAVGNLNTSTPAYHNASVALSSLWRLYQSLSTNSGRRVLEYGVNMVVEFSNGTRKWYNDTAVQPGWNGYIATLVLLQGRVNATWYPQFAEHFVTAVDGVSQTNSMSWWVWTYGNGTWTQAPTGPDLIHVDNGTTIAWTLCGYDSQYNPTCKP